MCRAPLPATVDRITPKGDPESKTFRVHLNLPDDTPLKVGMSVEANIIIREKKGVMLAPAEALRSQAGGPATAFVAWRAC